MFTDVHLRYARAMESGTRRMANANVIARQADPLCGVPVTVVEWA